MLELGDIGGKNANLCILGGIDSFLHGNSGAVLSVGLSELRNALHKALKVHLRLHKSRSLGSDSSHQSSDFVHELHQLGINGLPNVDVNGAILMGMVGFCIVVGEHCGRGRRSIEDFLVGLLDFDIDGACSDSQKGKGSEGFHLAVGCGFLLVDLNYSLETSYKWSEKNLTDI